ncbi:MAG: hypothetical protein HW412_970 [Bacteroidetes bacterium]|nr:hypothetical protein [Bacteroidota bacterium]
MKSHPTIWCFAVFMCVALFTNTLHAQGVTTAAINGKVTSTNGEALVGVNIVAVHNPSGSKYGTSTRNDGRYTLPNLRVGGPYSVTATYIGYQKQTSEGIHLRLSQNLDLNFSLVEEAVQTGEITILAERNSVFNSSRTGAATNVTRDQIDQLPTVSRSFQDYFKASPLFVGSNALGRNAKYNNIQIDGTNFNDLFGLGSTGTPAGQASGPPVFAPISLDAIEEFQIVASPYDVRQNGFTGAGVNVITRSGTNTPAGSVFYYGRHQGIMGRSPDTLKAKSAGFNDWQYGVRAGGAIVENSIFYFVNGEFTRFTAPFARVFGTSSVGTNAYPASSDSLNMLTNYLKTKYNYDPGSFRTVGNDRESDKFFVRFDFNLSENHKLTARWSHLRSAEDNSPSRGRGPTDIYFDNGKYRLDNRTHSVAVQLTSLFGNSSSNELIVGYVNQFDNPIFYGRAFPTVYIQTRGGPGNATAMNLILGAEQFRHNNELGQKTFEFTDNFSWYLPGHTVTLGANVNLLSFRNLFIPSAFGVYSYSSIARFMADLSPDANIASNNRYTLRYSATKDPLQEANWKARQFGFYAQDEWTVSSMLKVIAGVRADLPTYPDHPNYNFAIDSIFHYRTDKPPKASVALSPRLGFNWAFDEERTTQLRGGAGIFYGRFPYVWVSNQYSNTGVDFYTLGTANAPARFNPDPFGQAKPATVTLPSAEVDVTDPNFKAPSIIRYSLAIDHKLPFDLVASVEGIVSTTLKDVFYQNINLGAQQENAKTSGGATRANGPLTPGGKIVGENRDVWGLLRDSTTYTVQWVNTARFAPGVFLVKNTKLGSNANVTVQIQRNVPGGLNGLVGYTWGVAKDINSGNSATAGSGWNGNPTPGNPNLPRLTYSQWDRRHKITANLTYKQDWGGGLVTSLGVFYSALSGRPFSYMVSGDVNGDGASINDLTYIPRDANDIILMGLKFPDSAASSRNPVVKLTDKSRGEYTQLMSFINADDYLKANKGKISERSGPREPWSHQIDLRISQEVPTFSGHRIELTFDILNVLNLLNSDWGWVRTSGGFQTVNLFTIHSFETTPGADYGKPRYQLQSATAKVTDGKANPFQPDNLLSRWQAQFGIRYTF